MNRFVFCLFALSLCGALIAPDDARAQCAFPSGGATLVDGDGFNWDIDPAGKVGNGTIDAYDAGMSVRVGGTYFPPSTLAVSGREIVVGPEAMAGLNVTRKIYVSSTDGWARWVDLYENPTGADITTNLIYEINPGSDSSRQLIMTSSGDAVFTAADQWLVTDDSSNGSGDPTLNHNLHDGRTGFVPTSVSETVYSCASANGTRWDYSNFTVPAGRTYGIMTLLGQNSNQADATTNAQALASSAAGLDGLSALDRGSIVNRLLPKNVLFVSDNTTDTNIPAALTPDGHIVTTLTNQFSGNTTAALTGSLAQYDAVIWSATGTGFGSLNDDATMLANLEAYVTGGGRVYVTGYDSIASPSDAALAQFVGGTGAVVDIAGGTPPGAVANVTTSLSIGVSDIRNVVPTGGYNDRDAMTALAPGTVPVATSASNSSQWQWVVRPLGAGEIAYVSNGAHPSTTQEDWDNPTTAYNASLRNFVFGAGGGIPNQPPVADAGGPYSVNQGVALTVDGSGSTDPDGSITDYAWDCDTDGVVDASSASATNTCTYATIGSYTATLTVTDAGGLTDSATATVTVTNTAPVANAGGPYLANQGAPVALDGSASSDADGSVVLWEWDCDNDGTYELSSGSATGNSCTYANVGSPTIALRVTDNDGDTGTAVASATINNTPPTADAGPAYAGTKNFPIPLDGTGSSDPDGTLVSYAWDCTTDGVVDFTATSGLGNACTYPAVGSYTVTLTVTDDDGAFASASQTVAVGNDAPTANAGGPYAGLEATAITLDGSASTDAGGAIATWSWDCTTDGVPESVSASATVPCVYDDQGTFTATLVVTDDDGATSTSTATVTVSNANPIIASTTVPSGDEGATLSFSTVAGDAAGDTLTYTWDFGDGGSDTGDTVTYAYADDGVYSVTVTVADEDGGSSVGSGTATIANVDPTFTSVTAPTPGDEGAAYSFGAVVDDAGSADIADLVVTWSWGDGSADESGTSLVHTYADDGTYTVTVTVDDQDGGVTTQVETVLIGNIDPIITSNAPTNAVQGATYSYLPSVNDPGDEVFTWALSPSASANTVFDTATGEISWTPDSGDVAQGSFSLVLTVDDGDGGTDGESWTVLVSASDSDGDGMSDDWENDNGLNPNDPTDAGLDPDADGATNLDEFGLGTDPNSYDGPDAPVLVSPIAGDETSSDAPDLLLTNANDPQGDTLVYTYEVYSDAALTTLVTSIDTIAEDPSGQTEWKVDLLLSENTEYWWRAAASDSFVTGPFSTEESFFVNATSEAPDVPVLVYPIAGEIAPSVLPTLQWSESSDVDGDAVTYDVEVYDESELLVTTATGVVGDGTTGEWDLDVSLEEDRFYSWTVKAVDDEGLESDWAAEETFFVSEGNEPPVGTVFVAPADGQAIDDQSPMLVATEAVDPEGTDVVYLFEVDSGPGFDSADYDSEEVVHNGSGEVMWDLADSGVVLIENQDTYARVRATDADGISSVPDTIAFFVRGNNDAPSVPVLVSPADGAEGVDRPVLEVEDPVDSEGDTVFVEFIVARDEALTDVVTSSDSVLSLGGATTEWQVDVGLSGELYWSARSVDDGGAESDWATPWLYTVPAVEVGDDDDDDDTDPDGCACASSVTGEASPTLAFLLLLPLAGLLRRRR